MFGLFGKKKKAPLEDDDSQWTLAQGQDGEHPLIFRIRNNKPHWIKQASYPFMMGIAWEFRSNNGFPDKKIDNKQLEFEELLDKEFTLTENAILMVVVTGNGVREWQWYTNDHENFISMLNAILPSDDPLPIQISVEEDPNWEAYSQFKDALSQ